MYRNELENLLRRGQNIPAIMLYGDSHFLIDYYVNMFSKKEDANLLSLYHDEYNFASAKAHLSQGSLFGGDSVLLIKTAKKIAKKELDTLLALIQKNTYNTFIYAYYGPDMRTSAKSFNKKSRGIEVRLFNPNPSEARGLLLQEVQKKKIDLNSHCATHLLDSQNGDLALAFNELSKLQNIEGTITTKDIDDLVYGVGEVKMEQFMDQLLMKKDFRENLLYILESGEDEIRVVTSLSTYITQLYLFYIQIKRNGIVDSRAVMGFKLPPQIEKARGQFSIRFKQDQYDALLDLLLQTELKMKSSGKMDKNALLLAMLIKLQSLL